MKRRVITILVLAATAITATIVAVIIRRDPMPLPVRVDPAQVREIQLRHYLSEGGAPPDAVISPPRCAAILNALRDAQPTPGHRCMPAAVMTVVFANGREGKILILPGHHSSHYEYRGAERPYYRIPRAPFVAAMDAAGISHELLGLDRETDN